MSALRTLTRNWASGALATEVLEAALSRKPRGGPRLSRRAHFPEAMDGKEEIRVVEEQPAWQAGSLESLDVIDKVPDESVKLAADQ